MSRFTLQDYYDLRADPEGRLNVVFGSVPFYEELNRLGDMIAQSYGCPGWRIFGRELSPKREISGDAEIAMIERLRLRKEELLRVSVRVYQPPKRSRRQHL